MTETDKPAQFVRRPTVFEAKQWDGEYATVKEIGEWLDLPISWHMELRDPEGAQLAITTRSGGLVTASVGDWLIVDRGTLKAIPADKMVELYAPVDGSGIILMPPGLSKAEPKVEESPQSRLARQVKEAREGGSSPIAIVAPRRHGKTHVLLEEMLRDPNAVFVTHSTVAAEHAYEQYVELRGSKSLSQLLAYGMLTVGHDRHRFIAWHERAKQAGRRRRYLIDNVDYILAINGTSPSMITLSDQS